MKNLLIMVFLLLTVGLFAQSSIAWGNTQWPHSIIIEAGTTTENIYGQVYMSGVTDAVGEGVGITAELGYGMRESDPATTEWTWATSAYFGDNGNNDEYAMVLTVTTAGEYDYCYRYQYMDETEYYIAAERFPMTVNAGPLEESVITFQIDMTFQVVDAAGVFIAGSFNGWSATATQLTLTTDNIYTVGLTLVQGAMHTYKYINGSAWEDVADNRGLTVPEADTTLDLVYFSDYNPGSLTTRDITVTFSVNMVHVETVETVSIAGSMNNWTAGELVLSDDDMDNIYTVDYLFPIGSIPDVAFKYVNGTDFELDGEDNRSFVLDDTSDIMVLELVNFDNYNPDLYTSQMIIVDFWVDMQYAGEFSNLSIAGTWNDWAADDSVLGLLGDRWGGSVIFPAGTLKHVEYKLIKDTEWETGNNHAFEIDDTTGMQILDVVLWNDFDPADYTSADTNITINCDVSEAIQNVDFTSLAVCGNLSPLDWDFAANNHPFADMGDNIWSINLTFLAGSHRDLRFKLARNGEDNEAGFEENHEFRIGDAATTELNIDFGSMGTDADDNTYSIAYSHLAVTAYPNPFNPSTTIRLNNQSNTFGSVKIYNLRGQLIHTLASQQAIAANQQYTWDGLDNQGHSIASGIYFVQVQLGGQSATKKISLIK